MEFVISVDGFIFDLNFIAAAKIDTAVSFLRAVVFDVELEVVEGTTRADIGAGRFVDQHTIFDFPMILRGIVRDPSVEVPAVKERLGSRPGRGGFASQSGCADTGDLADHIAMLFSAGDSLAIFVELPLGAAVVLSEGEPGTSELDVRCGMNAAGAIDDANGGLGTGLDFDPGGIGFATCFDGQIPAAGDIDRALLAETGYEKNRGGEGKAYGNQFHRALV